MKEIQSITEFFSGIGNETKKEGCCNTPPDSVLCGKRKHQL